MRAWNAAVRSLRSLLQLLLQRPGAGLPMLPVLRLRSLGRPELQLQSGSAGGPDRLPVLHVAWSARFLARQSAQHWWVLIQGGRRRVEGDSSHFHPSLLLKQFEGRGRIRALSAAIGARTRQGGWFCWCCKVLSDCRCLIFSLGALSCRCTLLRGALLSSNDVGSWLECGRIADAARYWPLRHQSPGLGQLVGSNVGSDFNRRA